jgi:ParB-like chromosome segregation protein Spo0J
MSITAAKQRKSQTAPKLATNGVKKVSLVCDEATKCEVSAWLIRTDEGQWMSEPGFEVSADARKEGLPNKQASISPHSATKYDTEADAMDGAVRAALEWLDEHDHNCGPEATFAINRLRRELLTWDGGIAGRPAVEDGAGSGDPRPAQGALSQTTPADKPNGKKPRSSAGKLRKPLPRHPVWEACVVRLDQCEAHEDNREHSPDDIQDRAASLRESGQLDRVKVWQPAGGKGTKYVVLGGWGRVLAARKLGWQEIQASKLLGMSSDAGDVLPATDQDLLGILAEDNSQRSDLSVLEKATLGRKLVAAGFSQAEAARRVGFKHAGSLTNAQKLLDLPPKLRTLLDLPDGDPLKLPQPTLRELANYAHVPQLVDAFLEDLDANADEWRTHPEDSIAYVVRNNTRPVDDAAYRSIGFVSPAPKGADALPVIEIPGFGDADDRGPVRVTLATKEWDTLAHSRAKAHFQEDEADKPAAAAKPQLTAAEKREQARQKAEQLEKRRRRWEYDFRLQAVLRELDEKEDELANFRCGDACRRIILWAMCENQRDAWSKLHHWLLSNSGKRTMGSIATTVVSVAREALEAACHVLAVEMLRDPYTGNPDFPHVPFELLVQLCEDLNLDGNEEWRKLYTYEDGQELLRKLWATHETDQLSAVASTAGQPVTSDSSTILRKADLVEQLVTRSMLKPSWVWPHEPAKKGAKR